MTFRDLCEAIETWDGKKKTSHLDDKAMSVINRGLEVRPDRTEGNTFWDDFISVLGNNSEGASSLLGVSTDIIAGWSSKIKEALKRIRDENAPDDTHMEPTGSDQ